MTLIGIIKDQSSPENCPPSSIDTLCDLVLALSYHTQADRHPCPHTFTCAHMHTHAYAHTYTYARTHAHTCTHIHIHMYIHTCAYTCMNAYMCAHAIISKVIINSF